MKAARKSNRNRRASSMEGGKDGRNEERPPSFNGGRLGWSFSGSSARLPVVDWGRPASFAFFRRLGRRRIFPRAGAGRLRQLVVGIRVAAAKETGDGQDTA